TALVAQRADTPTRTALHGLDDGVMLWWGHGPQRTRALEHLGYVQATQDPQLTAGSLAVVGPDRVIRAALSHGSLKEPLVAVRHHRPVFSAWNATSSHR